MRAGSQLRGRIREDRPAQLRREIRQSGAEFRFRIHRATGDYTALARTRDLDKPFDIFRPWVFSTSTYFGVYPTAAIGGADLRLGCGRGRRERIGEWQIEVNGARGRAAGFGGRTASHFTRVSQHSTVGIGHSVRAFRADREALQELVANESTDVLAPIPHGTGQTLFRECFVVAKHNSYHLGQLVLLRRLLDVWQEDGNRTITI